MFEAIWKWKGLQRVMVLLWKVANNILMTMHRVRINIAEEGFCPRCPGVTECITHVLRDCPFAFEFGQGFFLGISLLIFSKLIE